MQPPKPPHVPRRLVVGAVLAAVAAFPATAGAALTIGPNAPALGFPASVTDSVSGISLTSCQDTSGFCVETPAPNQAAPLSVPGNYTPDGEAFYQLADATVPNAGTGLARFALEQAFLNDPPAAGEQILFGRLRFRFQGLQPNQDYRVTHPFGTSDVTADGAGIVNDTVDLGCLAPPCDFAAASYGKITSFLQWDPLDAPAPPAGYVGNIAVPHTVIGSPTGTNFVRLQELNGNVAGAVVGETDQFLLQGKLAGPPPPPAPFVVPDATSLSYTDRQVGTTSPPANVTLVNHGTAPLHVTSATVGGTDSGDFSVASNGCAAAVAPGGSCAIGVAFGPKATGVRSARLTVVSDALNTPQVATLKGSGTPASLPAPPPQVVQAPAPPVTIVQSFAARTVRAGLTQLRVTRRQSARKARARGLAVSFLTSGDADVARVRVIRSGSGATVASRLVALTRSGRHTVRLRSRKLRAGRYRVSVAVGPNARSLGQPQVTGLVLR